MLSIVCVLVLPAPIFSTALVEFDNLTKTLPPGFTQNDVQYKETCGDIVECQKSNISWYLSRMDTPVTFYIIYAVMLSDVDNKYFPVAVTSEGNTWNTVLCKNWKPAGKEVELYENPTSARDAVITFVHSSKTFLQVAEAKVAHLFVKSVNKIFGEGSAKIVNPSPADS